MTRMARAPRRGAAKILILAVVGLIGGVAGGWAVWGRPKEDPAAVLERREEPKHEETKKQKKPDLDELTYIDMGSFLVNIAAEDRLRYLQVEISLGVTDLHKEGEEEEEGKGGKKEGGGHGGGHGAKAEEEAPALSPAGDTLARDIIVRILSQQTFDHLRADPSGASVKKKLQAELDKAIYECSIEAVLFTSFLMQ